MFIYGMIGASELLIILIISFIVLGPEKMSEGGRTLGKFLREIKKEINKLDVNLDITHKVEQIKNEDGINIISNEIEDVIDDIHQLK